MLEVLNLNDVNIENWVTAPTQAWYEEQLRDMGFSYEHESSKLSVRRRGTTDERVGEV